MHPDTKRPVLKETMTPEEAINQEWKHHYEDMRNQRNQARQELEALRAEIAAKGAPVAVNLREDGARTIQEEIDEYERTKDKPSALRSLVKAVIDLRCPNCHAPVPVSFET